MSLKPAILINSSAGLLALAGNSRSTFGKILKPCRKHPTL